MIWIEGGLFLASSLFLARSSYEMFILTPRYGQQMIFFSLLHTWPERAIQLFFVSWSAYRPFVYFSVLFALIRLTVGIGRAPRRDAEPKSVRSGFSGLSARVVGWLSGPPGFVWSLVIYSVAVLAALHFGAAMTYDTWSRVLFREGV